MGLSTDEKPKQPPAKPEAESSARPPSYGEHEVRPLELPLLNLSKPKTGVCMITSDQCVAHLKFLAVLADLRDTISSADGLFGIYDSEADRYPYSTDEARVRIREKRWAVYTARAVDRYTEWWFKCLPMSRPLATISDLTHPSYTTVTNCETMILWDEKNMPPIDILMVWHSHMLNPRSFLEDCIRYGKMSTWKTGFPFEAVDRCINNHTLEYTVSGEAMRLFAQQINLQWDNLYDPPTKEIACPRCRVVNSVPWTKGDIGASVATAFKEGTGYADHSFLAICTKCHLSIDHGRLKVEKFRRDVGAVLRDQHPMPGSFYNINGVPEGMPVTANQLNHRHMMYPTRFIQAAGDDLYKFTDPRLDWCQDMSHLRKQLEANLKDKKVIAAANEGSIRLNMRPGQKVHFRRMMSRYWDNLGPFALDLVGAVIRQGVFVQKMDNIDWLHSPTVMDTANRIVDKYRVFFRIMMENPRHMAVPTLDVDLGWHTHQLMPSYYYERSTAQPSTGGTYIFIDHDDKVDENKLSDGFEWTSKMYRRMTDGGIYSECTCWYCEATRVPDLYDRIFSVGSASRARNAAEALHDRPDISSDPDKNPHISAHNAIRPVQRYVGDGRIGSIQRIRLNKNYEKLARRAEKRGRQRSDSKSTRDGGVEPNYAMPIAFGYAMAVPYYGPYMADPCVSADAYATNPGCMNVAPGGAGNCCSGTCGGGVAAGSCGGVGSGAACAAGCSGGSGGGCAGGGCGSGGCGGGGGGGGCGGGGGGGC
ncbi:Protein of unknown function DUF1399 [Penicillium alfredii]|uniref:Uncharacterized protein n=1 Tax=Penicillium alfredii TaxID=1506179 RepID=A0A9W9F8T5_9EURO|nr:Protein of unknown function DUF1399 [Penicillium alfredii]KAJ5095679.1 Protein of unknown function DUF1399 [Penicillium alfredii]